MITTYRIDLLNMHTDITCEVDSPLAAGNANQQCNVDKAKQPCTAQQQLSPSTEEMRVGDNQTRPEEQAVVLEAQNSDNTGLTNTSLDIEEFKPDIGVINTVGINVEPLDNTDRNFQDNKTIGHFTGVHHDNLVNNIKDLYKDESPAIIKNEIAVVDEVDLNDDHVEEIIIDDDDEFNYDIQIESQQSEDKSTSRIIQIPCDKCDHFFVKAEEYKKHKKGTCSSRDGLLLKCPMEGCRYETKPFGKLYVAYLEIMSNHLRAKHTFEIPFKCEICEAAFPSKSSLICHLKKHDLKDVEPPSAEEARLSSPGNSENVSIDMHEFDVNNPEYVPSDMSCHSDSNDSESINWRRTQKKVKEPAQMIPCDACDAKFDKIKNFRQHKIKKCSAKRREKIGCPFDSCDFVSNILENWRSALNSVCSHISAKHTYERAYQCDVCTKEFHSQPSLNYHKRMHSDTNKFYCSQCQHFFPVKRKQAHAKSHSQIKDTFKCKVCDKSFLRDEHLYAHTAIHTVHKYPCTKCEKKFHQSNNLKVHMERKHGQESTLD